jgi:dTDP-4-amino-4,6-dideoxygalactose transaminase
LGFFDDVLESKKITENYGARFLLDNCESSFSYYCPKAGSHKSILKLATSSTSIFFSHLTMSGTEGGLIFTESDEEAEWYRMARSHGLTRGMPEKYKNPNVNPDFDFYLLGSNYRSSNLQAYMASLDFERAFDFGEKRQYLFSLFNYSLPEEKYINIFKNVEKDDLGNNMYCPLAIPIVCKTEEGRKRLEIELKKEGVVTRPLIGGCLLAHTAFKKYGNMDDFPVAKKLHNCAIYIGLNKSITKNKIFALLMKIYSI